MDLVLDEASSAVYWPEVDSITNWSFIETANLYFSKNSVLDQLTVAI